jgi:ATP-dependent Clp protease ATP-binding subunit ClpC
MTGDSEEARYNQIRARVNDELKGYFRPEFLNRLDDTIVFRPLTRPEVGSIAAILVSDIAGQLAERGITLEVTEAFTSLVVNEGYDPSYGARPLRRALTRRLEDSLAEAMLSGEVKEGDLAIVDVDGNGTVTVSATSRSTLQLQPVS